ncbi:MAG: hypothetical protein HYR84_09735 [Planctomycetes bacterium]|nr:hypothetical protein [Planctomycetota bacterium]
MTLGTNERWTRHIRHTLKRYDDALLRQVAHRLCKPRNQWPVDELLDRIVSVFDNLAMVDRRLKEMPAACRQILAVIAQSRQPRWPVGSLVEILATLGAADGLAPIVTLLESGLLLPELLPFGVEPADDKANNRARLKDFSVWLGRSDPIPMVMASPAVTQRVLREDLGIECPSLKAAPDAAAHESDGLDWPLRLAVLWQQVLGGPLRRTQQGGFFKRDSDRLEADPLLSTPPTDALTTIPDPGFLAAALASASGLLRVEQAELRAGDFPSAWTDALPALLADLWASMPHLTSWNPVTGQTPLATPGNPYPSVCLLAMLLLARLPEKHWADPHAIEREIAARHPYWRGKKTPSVGVVPFLLGVAYSLRLVQATKSDAGWLVRLSPLARWAVGWTDHPPSLPQFKQTLLVQPNLEMLAYRQGMTPSLIASLSKIATWKGLGPACTLQLEPSSVYRALEMGESQSSIVQLLESHGMKALPGAVLDSLKTWSNKRERISVYAAGAIFEFATASDMNEAIARGLPAVRLTDRLAIVAKESDIDYKHFRLTGTRDYTLPPERCVDVEPDGVTLSVDLSRSDLLLETELLRFAEPIQRSGVAGRRYYQLTSGSILAARQQGVSLANLETWFVQRTGLPISSAAILLMSGADAAPVELRRQLVLHVASESLADGLQQWPATRDLVADRLGPTALVVAEENVQALIARLQELGVNVMPESFSPAS